MPENLEKDLLEWRLQRCRWRKHRTGMSSAIRTQVNYGNLDIILVIRIWLNCFKVSTYSKSSMVLGKVVCVRRSWGVSRAIDDKVLPAGQKRAEKLQRRTLRRETIGLTRTLHSCDPFNGLNKKSVTLITFCKGGRYQLTDKATRNIAYLSPQNQRRSFSPNRPA